MGSTISKLNLTNCGNNSLIAELNRTAPMPGPEQKAKLVDAENAFHDKSTAVFQMQEQLQHLREQSGSPGNNVTPVAAPPGTPPPATQAAGVTASTGTSPAAPEVTSRKIIRNGTVEFEVRSFDDTYATVATAVSRGKWRVSSLPPALTNSRQRQSPRQHRRARPARTPSTAFSVQLRKLGNLKAQQIAASDVTKEYTDIASELRGLRHRWKAGCST